MPADFQDLWQHFLHGAGRPVAMCRRAPSPPLDVVERAAEIIIQVELAGVDPADIQVRCTPTQIEILGQRRERNLGEAVRFHRKEIQDGMLSVGVPLPAPVNPARARAEIHDGLLTVRLPKLKSLRSVRESRPLTLVIRM